MLLLNDQHLLASVLFMAQMPDDYVTTLRVDLKRVLWKKKQVVIAKSKQTKLVVTVAVMVGGQKTFFQTK